MRLRRIFFGAACLLIPLCVSSQRLIAADEQLQAFRSGLDQLGSSCQELLRLLCVDPPVSYEDVSAALDIPKGSIGPTRQRCLERLRRIIDEGKSR